MVEDAAGATWVEDPDFDMKQPRGAEKAAEGRQGRGQKALQDRVADLAMQPLDPAPPLWQIHLVEDYPEKDGSRPAR